MTYTIGSQVFGDWTITRKIGEGSYGCVYEISKESFGITAKSALKVISVPRSVSEIKEALNEGMDEKSVTSYFRGIVNEFVREIASMSDLKSHPNIVSCEDYTVIPHPGEIGWDILIKMELLTSFDDYQLRNPLNQHTIICLAKDVCSAMMFCQQKGIIHRDIKPGNVFIDSSGRFKLGDFGVAKTVNKTVGAMSKQGTENYMAPEVYLGKPYGASVDIYSLGIMLYKLMNHNRLPFYPLPPNPIEHTDRENALIKRMKGKPFAPPALASEEFAQIILKACSSKANDRYQTAAEMLEALNALPLGSSKESILITASDHIEKTDSLFSKNESDNGEVTASPFSKEESEIDNTFSLFPDSGSMEDGQTFSPFSDSGSMEGEQTFSPFSGSGSTEGEQTFSPFSGSGSTEDLSGTDKKKEKNTTRKTYKPYKEAPDTDTPEDTDKRIRDFWKQNLHEVWKKEAKDVRWLDYHAPDIPPQIYSNALYYLTENTLKKSDVIAILDCTGDTRVPCSTGILITKDKVIVQLNMQILLGSFAVKQRENQTEHGFISIDIKDFKDYTITSQRVFFNVKYTFTWTTFSGQTYTYHTYFGNIIRFKKLGDLIKSAAKIL